MHCVRLGRRQSGGLAKSALQLDEMRLCMQFGSSNDVMFGLTMLSLPNVVSSLISAHKYTWMCVIKTHFYNLTRGWTRSPPSPCHHDKSGKIRVQNLKIRSKTMVSYFLIFEKNEAESKPNLKESVGFAKKWLNIVWYFKSPALGPVGYVELMILKILSSTRQVFKINIFKLKTQLEFDFPEESLTIDIRSDTWNDFVLLKLARIQQKLLKKMRSSVVEIHFEKPFSHLLTGKKSFHREWQCSIFQWMEVWRPWKGEKRSDITDCLSEGWSNIPYENEQFLQKTSHRLLFRFASRGANHDLP